MNYWVLVFGLLALVLVAAGFMGYVWGAIELIMSNNRKAKAAGWTMVGLLSAACIFGLPALFLVTHP